MYVNLHLLEAVAMHLSTTNLLSISALEYTLAKTHFASFKCFKMLHFRLHLYHAQTKG